MNKLEVKNISKTFNLTEKERKERNLKTSKKIAVSDVSFIAESGQIVGLIGPNGAGKTTTMRMLSSLIKPNSGEVLYNGENIQNNINIKKNISFMTSDLKLDPKSSANEMFDFFVDLYNIPKDIANKRRDELFEKFEITQYANTKISKLSQGMAQKVKIIISILHNPDFIIFDEPTNGLDVISARIIREYLLEMKKEGKCIILSTHLFDLAEKTCDRVIMIANGKVIADKELKDFIQDKDLEEAFYEIYTEIYKEEK